MRRLTAADAFVAAAIGLGLASPAAQSSVNFVDDPARELLASSRTAVRQGGGLVETLRALVLKGSSRAGADGGPLAESVLDIKVLLPGHFLRTDTAGSYSRHAGYAGATVLSAIKDGENVETPPQQLRTNLLVAQRAWLGRFLLGSAAYASPDLSLTFRSSGGVSRMVRPDISPESNLRIKEGTVEKLVLEVSGADKFYSRLFLDPSRMPSRVEYPAGKSTIEMQFRDRRSVGGLMLPHRVTTLSDGRVVDDMVFTEIQVNPALTPADFHR
jgi:hypothetical protein